MIPIVMDIIIKNISPKKIILFGSCAKKYISPSSDIDLCIVLDQKPDRYEKHKIRTFLTYKFLEVTDFEVDLYMCGAEEWENKYMDQSTFIGKIFKEGVMLYGR